MVLHVLDWTSDFTSGLCVWDSFWMRLTKGTDRDVYIGTLVWRI